MTATVAPSPVRAVPVEAWEWFGLPGHFIAASHCRFHLCTLIGEHLVSTVGEYLPDSAVREISAKSRGITLEGRGDAREADFLDKLGYEDIGYGRKYETMVFRTTGERCTSSDCGCGLPKIIPHELDFCGYNRAGDAARGHQKMCEKWSATPHPEAAP